MATLFRRNWDGIFMTKPKQYPDWICNQCGRLHGKRPEGRSVATYHIGQVRRVRHGRHRGY
jgi:hypothetical protein